MTVEVGDKLLSRVEALPTLPTVYSALSETLANPRSRAEDVARVISTDQASAMRVLKVVNSAFYGFPERIETIPRAIVILGFDEVRNLVLATSIMNLFSKKESALSFRPADFWSHSIAVGLGTRLIGQAARLPEQENLFVAGILHDVGKLLFFEHAEADFARALSLVAENNVLLRDAEREEIGMDHAQAGHLLSQHWKLPTPLRDVIRHHHSGLVGGTPNPLVCAAHLADFLARLLELGYPGDNLIPQPGERAWTALKLKPETLAEIAPALIQGHQEAVRVMLHG